MIRRRPAILLFGTFIVLAVKGAYAQEQAPEAEAPPTTQELTEEEQVWQRRFERAEGFREQMLQTRRGSELFSLYVQKNRSDVAENREKCLESMRRANRDAKFPLLLSCYRKELMLGMELREKQKQYVEGIPGVSQDVRLRAIATLDALIEATGSVKEGTESSVFRNEEELIEAKKNLHAVYGVPALQALLQLEADRAGTWIAHLMHRLLTVTQNTELGPDAFAKASEALQCFTESEIELADIGTPPEFEERSARMRALVLHLQTCVALLRDAHDLQDAFENPPVEEQEDRSQYSPRRRWSGN